MPSHDPNQSEVKTQYVLSGQPTGWAAMAKILHEYDDEKVKNCKEDIDTLATMRVEVWIRARGADSSPFMYIYEFEWSGRRGLDW